MAEAPTALVLWERARVALSEARSIDEVKAIRDKAQALTLYAKQIGESLEMQNNIAEIKLRAERRAGEMLRETEKNKGTAGTGDANIGRGTGGTIVLPPVDDTPTLADMGISKGESSNRQKVAAIPEVQFERHIAETKAEGYTTWSVAVPIKALATAVTTASVIQL